MGYAVELYFNSQIEKRVRDLRHTLVEQGISSTLDKLGDRPHVSLAVFSDVDFDKLASLAEKFANEIEPFEFQLSAISTFPTDENVLFLSPIPTNQLLNCHHDFHHRLTKAELTPLLYYVPENWMPHCSIEMDIPNKQLTKAMEVCKKSFTPLLGQFQEIGIVKFRPVKPLASWSLGN